MPTPSSNPPPNLPPRTHSSSCPEEARSSASWRPDQDGLEMSVDSDDMSSPEPVSALPSDMVQDIRGSQSATESPSPDSPSATEALPSEPVDTPSPAHKPMDADDDTPVNYRIRDTDISTQRHSTSYDAASAVGAEHEKIEDRIVAPRRIRYDMYEPSMGYGFSKLRTMPTSPSSFLRPGSKFHGTQQSEKQVYEVQVEIKYVDLRESFLCGYLKIQGLTKDNPTLTTYFDGEIINGSKYGFITKHESWGATEKIDLSHWAKFNAFRQYSKQVRKGPVSIPNLTQRENIFMRWKEHFLVPDHRVTTINGASFEGFYYICFNQKAGSVSGIYFHAKSEKFQQLELKHVEDRGCFSSVELR
ncbi:vacuolar import and degradation protein-domain-containing protein [Biscogniauxia mediterranea]|nr:vacuolar import and degradation protein-domain-containing protein [Biscogniauxia mediterranea]